MTSIPRVWPPALLSGLLLYPCFFPLNLGFLAWIALVPWFALVQAERPRSRGIYFACFIGALLCHVGLIQWIRVAHPAMHAAWAVLALFCACGYCVSLFLARRLFRAGLPLWLAGPVALVAVDYGKSHFPVGFPWLEFVGIWNPIGFGWYSLGHSQHDFLPLIQLADVTGVYGISFIVAMINAVLFESLRWLAPFRRLLRLSDSVRRFPIQGVAVALVSLLGTLGYGFNRLNHEAFEPGPEVALIQGNLPQSVKNEHGEDMTQHFGKLCDKAVFVGEGQPQPDLVVWPETSYTGVWLDVAPGADLKSTPLGFQREYQLERQDMKALAARWRKPMFYGINRIEFDASEQEWKYNSGMLFDDKGTLTGTYDKIHLVPLGEYVPLLEYFPFLKFLTPYDQDYHCRPGRSFTRFHLPTAAREYTFGCLICYEDSDATLARRYITGPEPVDFLVNISNDGWFNGTEEHEQHLAIARFRAIECRRSVVRAVNMGISTIIDADGRIVTLPGETWATSKKIAAIVRGRIPLSSGTTIYARWGDWLPLGTWLLMAILVCRRLVFGRRNKPETVATV